MEGVAVPHSSGTPADRRRPPAAEEQNECTPQTRKTWIQLWMDGAVEVRPGVIHRPEANRDATVEIVQ
jgi:hypothetical protein